MIVLYVIGGLILLILLVAAFIGTGWTFERSILINAPKNKVWKYTGTLAGMNQWNPWMDRDPTMQQELTGTDGTPGATYSWDSQIKNVGAGRQTIVSVTPEKELALRINFIRPFKGIGEAYVRLQEEQGQTRVSWGIASSTPYPMNIIKLTGVMEKNMDREFSKGLRQLKSISEL